MFNLHMPFEKKSTYLHVLFMQILYIFDSCPLVAEGFCRIIDGLNIEVQVRYFTSADKCIEEATQKPPDIFIGCLSPNDSQGEMLANSLRNISNDIKIVLLFSSAYPRLIHCALKLQPQAILFKEDTVDEIKRAIDAVVNGDKYFGAAVQNAIVAGVTNLSRVSPTRREVEVLKLIAKGRTTKEIATELNISENTIETYRKALFAKFKVNNSTGLVVKAMELGFVDA